MLKIYNTLNRTIEEFKPINPEQVSLYTCGMTVYDYAHIGHGRKYVGDDLLRRSLTYLGFKVKHVQNVTDVGHLASDADEGEDKLEKGATKAGKTVWEVAELFTKHFYDSMDKLNILRPDIICKATDHISDQIELVKILMRKGYAYDTPEALYFDISKFPEYGRLSGQKLNEKSVAVRTEVKTGKYKKHPADFALWFKRVGRFENHTMHWDSPWGDGFPGWHIECSAMSMKYLGESIDIHTGGIDHISVHHPNEIAQSEASTGKKFVRYWIHHAFLMVNGEKMSKSLGNIFTVEDVIAKGFNPLSLRYFYLTAHYRTQMNFTWSALSSAQNSLNELQSSIAHLKSKSSDLSRTELSEEKLEKINKYREMFIYALENDLNIPQALSCLWQVIKSNIPPGDKLDLILDFDQVLGLSLDKGLTRDLFLNMAELPLEIQKLITKRENARGLGDFQEADNLRGQILKSGYIIEDTPEGIQIKSRAS